MTAAELLVIPLVALQIPIILALAALLFDAVADSVSWIAYRWYDGAHPLWWRLPHRSV